MTGEDASPAAPACRIGPTVSRERVVTAAAKLANACRRVIEHQGLMGSSAYLKSGSHRPPPSRKLAFNQSRDGVTRGAGIPHEVEASKAVYHSLPERAEACNVHTPALRFYAPE
jgi:hypothetical protein